MTRRLTVLLLLFVGLSLSFPAGPALARTVNEPTRLTRNGGFDRLWAWQPEGLIAARDAALWTIAPASGTAQTCAASRCAAVDSPAEILVEQTTHRLVLNGATHFESSEEVLGRPALSADGQSLVLSRTPHGSETASLGELWRYDLRDGTWMRLTHNGVEESTPVISPDGRSVAFLRDGDVWLIPAGQSTYESLTTVIPRPVRSPAAEFSHTPPAVIRVKHVAANNCRPDAPNGEEYIVEVPFEEYVKRVVPHESPPGYPAEALKAQAVAARTYAWRYVDANPDAPWHVDDSTAYQYMCNTTYEATNAAVDATAGQHLTYNGTLIPSLFSAENASPTKQNAYGHVYLSAVDDPLSFGERRRGHGQGYSQVGARRLAEAGWGYLDILLHYYMFASVEPPAGSGATLVDTNNRPVFAYVRSSALLVGLNAANVPGTQAREYRIVNGQPQVGGWIEDHDGSNGYRHLFQIAAYEDARLDDYRIEFAPLGVTPGDVLYLGIDRTAPELSAQIELSGPITPGVPFNATLTTSSSDGTSGIAQTGWSQPAWQEQAEAGATYGTVVADSTASGGAALRYDPATHDAVTYSTEPKGVSAGYYRVWVRVRTPYRSSDTQVATIRVFDDGATALQRGVRYIMAGDFPPGSGWAWFYADVDGTSQYTGGSTGYAAQELTVKVEWHGLQRLDIDEVVITTRPADPHADAIARLTNPDPVRVFAADGAGNPVWRRCVAQHIGPLTPERQPSGYWRRFLPLVYGFIPAPPPPPPGNYRYVCD